MLKKTFFALFILAFGAFACNNSADSGEEQTGADDMSQFTDDENLKKNTKRLHRSISRARANH
jgi:hypothetical protein